MYTTTLNIFIFGVGTVLYKMANNVLGIIIISSFKFCALRRSHRIIKIYFTGVHFSPSVKPTDGAPKIESELGTSWLQSLSADSKSCHTQVNTCSLNVSIL